eukprot:399171-Pleurochrysis_carterae.AAC.1
MVKTYTVRPKVFYGEPDPNEAPPRRPTSFSDPLPYQLPDPPLRALPALGLSSATLALEPPQWLHSLQPCTDGDNSSPQAVAWPPSMPPSPPASEQSWTEQQPSRLQVSSARVTHSQSRAREKAGLPSLVVGSLSPAPVLSPPDIEHVDEVDGSRKQPRFASPPPTNLTPESDPLSDDSDGSSLFHPRRRSSDGLPEPGADGAGSSTYHSLLPPDVPDARDESAASSPDPWRHAQHPPD